jgi:very-short-patch-repair endonuclease
VATLHVRDLPKDLQRELLKGVKIPTLKAEPNEGEDLFRFHLKAHKLPKWMEQHKFATCMGREFMADFAFKDFPVLVEINGGIWREGGGAHSRPEKIIKDMERYRYAARLGLFILPFTPDEVFSGLAIDWTMETLRQHGWRP